MCILLEGGAEPWFAGFDRPNRSMSRKDGSRISAVFSAAVVRFSDSSIPLFGEHIGIIVISFGRLFALIGNAYGSDVTGRTAHRVGQWFRGTVRGHIPQLFDTRGFV